MKSTPERLAYSVDEAAIVTGKTSKAIRVLISRNQFPHRRRGRSIVILRSDLEEFLAGLPGISVAEALDRIAT